MYTDEYINETVAMLVLVERPSISCANLDINSSHVVLMVPAIQTCISELKRDALNYYIYEQIIK